MGILRVLANANEFDEYVGTELIDSPGAIAPNFQSYLNFNSADTVLAATGFSETEIGISFFNSRGTADSATSGRHMFALFDTDRSTTIPLLAITKLSTTADAFGLQRNTGSALGLVDNIVIPKAGARVDIRYKVGTADGEIDVYVNFNKVAEFRGNTNPGGNAKANRLELKRGIGLSGASASWRTCISGMFIADEDTRKFTLYERRATGDGVFNEWEGARANIIPSNDPITTYIEATGADQRNSYTYANIPASGSAEVAAVIVSGVMRELIEDNAPVALFFRDAGGDITDTAPVSVGSEFKFHQVVLPDNGGSPWTFGDINSGQFGVVSR